MSVYTELQAEATKLLDTYGETVVITLASGSKLRVKGIFTQKKKLIEDVTSVAPIIVTERQCIIQGNSSKKPNADDTLTFEKIDYNIVDVEEVRPTSTTLLYKLTLSY